MHVNHAPSYHNYHVINYFTTRCCIHVGCQKIKSLPIQTKKIWRIPKNERVRYRESKRRGVLERTKICYQSTHVRTTRKKGQGDCECHPGSNIEMAKRANNTTKRGRTIAIHTSTHWIWNKMSHTNEKNKKIIHFIKS